MSGEMQTNNTIKRKRGEINTAEWERLVVKGGSDVCIITQKDLVAMDKKIAEMQSLKEENARLQQQVLQGNESNKKASLLIEELKKGKDEVHQLNIKFASKIVELEREKRRLEESYKALNIEYGKLKVFKENAGRGRQYVLTPSQVGQIRAQALEGWSIKQSHESLLDDGVEVSYETVRKVVAEMTAEQPSRPSKPSEPIITSNIFGD